MCLPPRPSLLSSPPAAELSGRGGRVCPGVQWVQGRQPSWFTEFRLAGSGGGAGSLISISSTTAVCCCCDALLLSSSSTSTLPTSPFTSLYLFLSSAFFFFLFLQPCTLPRGRRPADRVGFVMNGILVHIRRKCMLQGGFPNCLHCPGNDSVNAAASGSQPGSQQDPQHRANRRTTERRFRKSSVQIQAAAAGRRQVPGGCS